MNIKAAKTAAILTAAILGATAAILAIALGCVAIAITNPVLGLCLGLGALVSIVFAMFYYIEK
jgi:hypothetical protein